MYSWAGANLIQSVFNCMLSYNIYQKQEEGEGDEEEEEENDEISDD